MNDSYGVVKFVNFLPQFLGALKGLGVKLNGLWVFFPFIVGNAKIIIEIILGEVVFADFDSHLFGRVVVLRKDITQVLVRGFIVFVLLNTP